MDWLQAVVLALIQGLTEFLPISSSAHLILPSQLLGWPDQGIAFDVAVHLGTLLAVVYFFRADVMAIGSGARNAVVTRKLDEQSLLGLAVVVGTVPAVLVGFAFKSFIEDNLRTSLVIATTTIAFGLLLWVADKNGKSFKSLDKITLGNAWLIGCAQCLALIPGTSRSGITITAALMLGYDRAAAARFSMLLSIPLILAAGMLAGLDLLRNAHPIELDLIVLGVLVSALSAYACIHFFLKMLDRIGMLPFVIYRLALGVFLLLFVGFQ